MSGTVDRFKKRRAVWEGKAIPNTPYDTDQPSVMSEASARSFIVQHFEDRAELTSAEADTLLAEIHGRISDEKISALIDACQRECLQAVIRPFGVARVLFHDKNGGNVTTTHNFAAGVVATDRDEEAYKDWKERNSKGNKDRQKHRQKTYDAESKPIRDQNKKPAAPNIVSGYTGNTLEKNKDAHYEHITSVSEIEKNPGINLRMTSADRVALATSPKNTTYVEAKINKSKKNKDLMAWSNNLSESEKTALELKPDLIGQEYRKSKRHIATEHTKSWIKKDGRELLSTGASDGTKMATQQAIGILMEEFVLAAFAEARDVWDNGFSGRVDETFMDVLKGRLLRVADRVQDRWKDAAFAFRDGFLSGFLSNLVTYAINMFVTTAAKWGRIVREGFMTLYRALKTLAFPPEGLSLAEVADAASKLLATGLVSSGGILLEAVLAPYLQVLGPLAPYVSTIGVGVATGLATTLLAYMLDHIDVFGVNAQSRHAQVIAKLDDMISISYERAVEAASVFGFPPPKQLT